MLELKQLIQEYHLPNSWSMPEIFTGEFLLEEFKSKIVAMSSYNKNNVLATGSSISLNKAFFELCERIAIIELESSHEQKFDFYGENLAKTKSVSKDSFYHKSLNNKLWQYSKSNGVAIHKNFKQACINARFELIERDLILRSWYGEFTPKKIPIDKIINPFPSFYSIEGYIFQSPKIKEEHACAFFAFPHKKNIPVSYGFGASNNLPLSLKKAQKECLQRLAFLYKTEIPKSIPTFLPTPDHHQEVFIHPLGERKLRKWLKGYHLGSCCYKDLKDSGDIFFVDISPVFFKNKLYVVKAISEKRLPLIFGKNYNIRISNIPESLMIHPIC